MDVILLVNDFFLSSLGRNDGNLLDLLTLKLLMASPLYISIACKRIWNCVTSSRACVHCEVLNGLAGLMQGNPQYDARLIQ